MVIKTRNFQSNIITHPLTPRELVGKGRSLRHGKTPTLHIVIALLPHSSSVELLSRSILFLSEASVGCFCFLFFILFLSVHSRLLDMNSFSPRNTKLGHMLWKIFL